MRKLILLLLLSVAQISFGQNDLPLEYKGNCVGHQTDINDHSAIPSTPAINCNAMTVAQIEGHTLVSFSNGDPSNPVLMFSGELVPVHPAANFNPYLGPISSAFSIDRVMWGDGKPASAIQAGEHMDQFTNRGCYFHFTGHGWGELSMVECELASDTPDHRPRRVMVTFRTAREFTIDAKQVSVEYGAQGPEDFTTHFDGHSLNGTCGLRLYQVGGVLKHVEPGTSMDRLFKVVCYKDVPQQK